MTHSTRSAGSTSAIAHDSFVVITCFGGLHEHHRAARSLLAGRPSLSARAAAESDSVLTRLADSFAPNPCCGRVLQAHVPTPRLALDPPAALLGELAELGISGDAVYDAMIASRARHAETELQAPVGCHIYFTSSSMTCGLRTSVVGPD